MAEIAADMLRTALDAFTAEDAETSREVIKRDRKIDDRCRREFGNLIDQMMSEPIAASGAAYLLFVAKHLGSIRDYVKNICEQNVYFRETVFLKHGGRN